MATPDSPARRLREALAAGPVLAPFAADPLTALLVQKLGFSAAYVGGGGLGYLLGVTEARLTSTDVVNATRLITNVCDLPLIIDGTTGFGDAIHTLRTVRELEAAGAAGVEVEDQLVPKRAHHHRGVDHPVRLEEMVEKVQAAVDARRDPEFVVIARTNTFLEVGFDEGLRRAVAYAEAGADMVLVRAQDAAGYARLPGIVPKPLVAMTIAVGDRPALTPRDYFGMGYALVLEAQAGLIAAYAAVREGYERLAAGGYVPMDRATARSVRTEIDELCGLPALWEIEERTTERPDRIPPYE